MPRSRSADPPSEPAGEPWRRHPDRERGSIGPRLGGAAALAWGLTGAWVGLALLLAREIAAAPRLTALVLLALGTLALVVWALVATARWRRFGGAVLELAILPGAPGGELAGTLHLGTSVMPEGPFQLELRCLRRTRRGHDRSRVESLWQQVLELPAGRAERGPAGTALPFRFQIPDGLPASGARGPRERIVWRLEARARLSGPDLACRFAVPVGEETGGRRG